VIELFYHLFVWIISPAAVGGTAIYGMMRREWFLGAFASAGVLLACAAIAMWMFEGHLLFYQLIYTVLISVPASIFVVAAVQAGIRLSRFIMRNLRPASTS
jgi:hypothetical protein